jgi:hypothetical protein
MEGKSGGAIKTLSRYSPITGNPEVIDVGVEPPYRTNNPSRVFFN